MIFEAVDFATRHHEGQFRKGTPIPYIVHPLSVMRVVMEGGASEVIGAAAVLHDTIEDTAATSQMIRDQFGERVCELVEAMTEPAKSGSWEHRKQHTLDTLAVAGDDLLFIALADKWDNLSSMERDLRRRGDIVWTRFQRPREKQAWYYRSLAGAFRGRFTDPYRHRLLQHFDQLVLDVFGV